MGKVKSKSAQRSEKWRNQQDPEELRKKDAERQRMKR